MTDGDGATWHADVGFGLGTLLDPIPFGPSGIHEQSGWSFQVVEESGELVLQTRGPDGWSDVYAFPPTPALRIDIEVNNWWICTNPASPFVFGLVAAINHADGRREALYDFSGHLEALTMIPGAVPTTTPESRDAIPALLSNRFGLVGFTVNAEGRVVPSGWEDQ